MMNIKGVKNSAVVLYGQFNALKDVCNGYHTIIRHRHLFILVPFDMEGVFNRAQMVYTCWALADRAAAIMAAAVMSIRFIMLILVIVFQFLQG